MDESGEVGVHDLSFKHFQLRDNFHLYLGLKKRSHFNRRTASIGRSEMTIPWGLVVSITVFIYKSITLKRPGVFITPFDLIGAR